MTNTRLPGFALLSGNFVIGVSVLAPAGMLKQLADSLSLTIAQAGMLMTIGAVILCIGSPVMAWATSHIERRRLLAGSIALLTLGHAASMLAPNFTLLLVIRVLSMAAAAVFTPIAASTIALIVPERERSGAISFIFLGWSLAIAAGLPVVTFLAAHLGWREAYGALAAAGALSFVLVAAGLPAGLRGAPVNLASWAHVLRSRLILSLLLVTALASAGQFIVFTYLGPLLGRLVAAGPTQIALFFGGFGLTGLLGNLTATRVVGRFGAFATSLACFLCMFAGAVIWSLGAGTVGVMAIGILMWGMGFASSNSMQQARLVGTAPELASATVALNTSAIYVGQAVGSGLGGFLFARDLALPIGYIAAALLAGAVGIVILSCPTPTSSWARSAR